MTMMTMSLTTKMMTTARPSVISSTTTTTCHKKPKSFEASILVEYSGEPFDLTNQEK
jgi:hypothetical protein